MLETTKEYLRKVKCHHILNGLESFINHADRNKMSYLEFTHMLFEKEVMEREQITINRRFKKAKLPALKTFDDFDHSYQQCIIKKKIKSGCHLYGWSRERT